MGPGGRERGMLTPKVAWPSPVFSWSVVLWASNPVTWWASPVVLVSMGFFPFLQMRFPEWHLSVMFHLFPASMSAFISFLLVQVETCQCTGIYVYECIFSSFLKLYWWYSVLITTANTRKCGPSPQEEWKLRMCIDFTELNKACKKDPFPLPRMDTSVNKAVGCQRFTLLDCFSWHH
jgi:hypothetical protein